MSSLESGDVLALQIDRPQTEFGRVRLTNFDVS